MADLNRWNRTLERRTLEALRGDITVLRAMARGHNPEERGQRRMANRIISLIDAKLMAIREADERADSWSEDSIAPELKA